jgi:hypothetical protein
VDLLFSRRINGISASAVFSSKSLNATGKDLSLIKCSNLRIGFSQSRVVFISISFKVPALGGKLNDGVQQNFASQDNVLHPGILLRAMTASIPAGDKNHAGLRQAGYQRGVVPGTTYHIKRRHILTITILGDSGPIVNWLMS